MNFRTPTTLLVIVLSLLGSCWCERILFFFPIASKSHKNVFDPLINALAERGHDMTIVTPFPAKVNTLPPNIRELSPLSSNNLILTQFEDPFEMRKRGKMSFLILNVDNIIEGCHKAYRDPEFQELLTQKFDLVIMNGFLNSCFDGILHRLGAPYILITTFAAPSFITEFTGNHLPSSFVPNPFISTTDRMTFTQRLGNWVGNQFFRLAFLFYYKAVYEDLYREHLGSDTPEIRDIHSNVSLIFMNSHFSLTYPRPNLPDNIEVGGMHCRPAKPLPKDLDEYLSGAGHGFIYFSLGSIVQAKNMPEEYRKMFINAFGRLKQRVIWKWETEEMADLPSNVKLSKWLPQQDILGHKNIRLFITHGGLLSTQEAVYHGVQMLGIPMFGDQDLNMIQAEAAGFALKLEILELTQEVLEEKLNRLLNEPTFDAQAKKLSAIFRDQSETPVERAVYWAEYVIRHKGAQHLRSAARQLNLFQIHSMDVIGFLSLLALLVLIMITLTCSRILKCLFGRTSSKNTKGAQRNFSKKRN